MDSLFSSPNLRNKYYEMHIEIVQDFIHSTYLHQPEAVQFNKK